MCCHNDTWFHLKLTLLKPWANQCIFLVEMFVLSNANVPWRRKWQSIPVFLPGKSHGQRNLVTVHGVTKCTVHLLCLQVGSTWQTSMLYSHIVLLIYVNETIYLYRNLPFSKIHVNHFMAWDDSPGANVISTHVVGEGPGAILGVLRHFLSLISRLLVSI